MRKALIALLVTATIALAFIQIDDTHVQTVLTGAIKTFQDAIRFQATGGGSEYVGIVGPAVVNTPSVTYKLPQNDGTAGQAMVTDGSANLSFATVTGATPTPQPTATPLVFGTPGVLVAFNATELGSYPGAVCPTPQAVTAVGADGSLTCASVGGGGTTGCGTAADNDVTYWTSATTICGDSNFTFDHANKRILGQNLVPAPDASQSAVRFQISAPLVSSTPSATQYGLINSMVVSGTDNVVMRGISAGLSGTWTGNTLGQESQDIYANNATLGIAHAIEPNWTNTSNWTCDGSGNNRCGNVGVFSDTFPSTQPTPVAGDEIGVFGSGAWSLNRDVGGYFKAAASDSAIHLALLATAANSSQGTNWKNVAGYFSLADGLITGTNTSSAIVADNGLITASIFRGYERGILVFDLDGSVGAGVSNGSRFKGGVGTGTAVPGVVTWSSFGGDTNVDMSISPKGGGFVTSTAPLEPVAAAVGSLPTCDSTRKGARSTATDCNAACTFAGTCTTGGSTVCPMYCDGSAWKEG